MPQSSNHFKSIADRIDVVAAVIAASKSNDLLPPRIEDRVGGEVGKRFSELLTYRLIRGLYEPERASIVSVPKPGYTTRPAAMLSLPDRTVYEAIVATLRQRIELALVGDRVAFWPRAEPAKEKRWAEFEASPLEDGMEHVVLADVAGFYEQVDHEHLADALIKSTGRRAEVEALVEFLGRIIGAHRGLPQGLDASDALATFYLAPVDREMLRMGAHYSRHGDDMRVAAASYSDGRRLLHALEASLRKLGLSLNPKKSRIIRKATYTRHLKESQRKLQEVRDRLLRKATDQLKSNSELLGAALVEAGLEQIGWNVFYHGNMSPMQAIELLAPKLEPSDIAIAEEVFADTIAHAPGEPDELLLEVFHHQLTSSLVRLSAAKSVTPLPSIASLLDRFPDKTEYLVAYLLSLSATEPASVTLQAEAALFGGQFRTGWEQAWILRVLCQNPQAVSANSATKIQALAANEGEDWVARLEALRFLGARGELQQELTWRLWNLCPAPHRADVIVAVHSMAQIAPWAKSFLDGTQDDPVHLVVLRHLEGSR